ncbi:MAG: hypothetical protein V7K92_10450 [Nostoc sp.]
MQPPRNLYISLQLLRRRSQHNLGDALASKIPVWVRHGSTTSAAAPSSDLC